MPSTRHKSSNVVGRYLILGAPILFAAVVLARSLFYRSPRWSDISNLHRGQKWTEYPGNPVLPDEEHSEATGTVFDLVLYQEKLTLTGVPADIHFRSSAAKSSETAMHWRMWNSWRPSDGIAYSTSVDGRTWNQSLQMSLGRNDSGWENWVNRPFVKKVATGKYAMWYTGQSGGVGGNIGYAESSDGITFQRTEDHPVMVPTLPWEKEAVMTPTLIDLPHGTLRMYYAGGESYEPDAIGAAHSYDGGLTWVKHGNSIFQPDTTSGDVGLWWDSHKVTSPHVIRGDDGYYYMFYAGFRNVDYSSIGLARSKDGLTNWERHVGNPIVDIVADAWNCDAVYKPFAGWDEEQHEWLLWYNGRCGALERIGLSTLKGRSFRGFLKRG